MAAAIRLSQQHSCSLLQALMHLRPPGGTSIQAMVANRHSLVRRFPGPCLTQFMRHYNWICGCTNKKSAEDLNAFAATGHTVVYASRCRSCAFDTMHFKYRPELL